MSKADRSVMSDQIQGFPDKSTIQERLIQECDLASLVHWVEDFGPKARAIIKNIESKEKCTQTQAKALSDECFQVARKRMKKKHGA